MITALVLSLALTQFTEAQRNGLIKSAQDAVAAVNAGGTISRPTQTRLTFGANITAAQVTAGAKCILCSIFVDEAQGDWLGVPRAYFDADASRRYALMRVCGAPETRAEPRPIPTWLSNLIDTCSKTPLAATAGTPRVTVAAATDPQAQAVATGWTAACCASGACEMQVTDAQGATSWVPAPKNLTVAAGKWRGGTWRLKPEVQLFGFESMPLECQP